ncbi:polyadenylate-binding protein RBP45-like isoform X2 [Juglans microcarpa x Juglans regia]|uniref:polyadenylate-binding protein RBP45-like isoform X2 n=1 Tax=Juglans microcarpa x Juglans regia TaxID=2249226 RepID=UPI001B7E2199|nr:polyadenylate-binding protein RBP45-like isoform X2 [Juglans microcarpa x Juglans regia]
MMQPAPTGVAPPTMPHQPQQYPPQQQQQSPYMMMPPPAAQAPPQMWPPQQVQPQPQPQHPQPTSVEEVRTLWIGDLQYWMDENYLFTCFAQSGEVISVKVIRNKLTAQSEGYGFVEFSSRAGAERVLQTYNGTIMPNGGQNFRLNWATFGSGERRSDDTSDFTIFVGDLAPDVTDYTLQETFRARYPSVRGAKVVIDRLTGRTKGYGFVRFGDEGEQLRAMTEMNGVLCSSRPMRIGPATNKNSIGGQQPKGLANRIEWIFRNFLWEGNGKERKFHLVSCKKVCSPASCGGLGVRNLKLFLENGFGSFILRWMRYGEILLMLNMVGCGELVF